MDILSRFLNKKRYIGEIVDLQDKYKVDGYTTSDGVGTSYYDIYLHNTNIKVGMIELRDRADKEMYYYGHVGYHIIESHRGNNYAYWACKILFEIIKQEDKIEEVIITCSPDNIASYKTLIKLGGRYIETVSVPKDHYLYKQNEKEKCVFKFRMSRC